jgi:ABC-2 type transport system permease protein
VLLQRVNYERFKDLLAWCQILFSFIVFFGYQLFPRLIGQMHRFQLGEMPRLVGLLPPAWFASLNELGLGHFSSFGAFLGVVALVTMLVLLPGLLKSVSLNYSDRIGAMVSEAVKRGTQSAQRKRGTFLPWLERVSSSDPEERAMFGFLFRMLRRNRQLKMQLYPNFGIMIALFVLAALDRQNQNDPLAGGGLSFGAMLPLMTFLFAAAGFTAALPYSDEYLGGWIFHVAPIARPERFLKAIKKALFFALFVPLFLLNGVLFSLFWPLTHALALSFYGLTIGLVMFQAALFRFRAFPFSRKPEKGAQSERLGLAFLMVFANTLFVAFTLVFGSHPEVLPITAAVLLGLSLLLGRLNNRAYARAIRQLEFAAE